ncbi:voltage-gated potassium channel [Phellopilus nigrolimitatus]|nr:voltage-gated potassium channel [Phellopilus nigrolimitatus]
MTAMLPSKDDLRTLPVFAPLVAAVFAPLSTLLDIPALTEPWFFQTDADTGVAHALNDPRANLVLSAVGLAFNVLANALLIVRFSVTDGYWRGATRASMICWVLKFGIALGNVLAFGILTRNEPDIAYGEGFWCAVVSLLVCAVIVALLLVHYYLRLQGVTSDRQHQVRIAGRHFMLQNTLFVGTIAILALFMSRVENWSYLQGIYFSVVSFLTIVLFPFVLVGIVQLASLIDFIVRFFRSRLTSRHAQRRLEFERRRQEEEDKLAHEPSLERELEFLRKLYTETDRGKTVEDLIMNSAGFMTFWVIGALIFSQIESWTYGQGLYFCYVFFFSIGYGDYTPVTPAGRVVFVIYSLIAVPIMTSFAVQTIQNLIQRLSIELLHRKEAQHGIRDGQVDIVDANRAAGSRQNGSGSADFEDGEKRLPQDVQRRLAESDINYWKKSHNDYIAEKNKRIEAKLAESGLSRKDAEDLDGESEEAKKEQDQGRDQEEDRVLTEYLLELAVELEKQARRLLLGNLKLGSSARMLLKADRIVQLQNIRGLAEQEESTNEGVDGSAVPENESREGGENSLPNAPANRRRPRAINDMMRKFYEEETELIPRPDDQDDQETLDGVVRYREAFAGLLAAGSRLLKLKDEEKFLFERRLWKPEGRE